MQTRFLPLLAPLALLSLPGCDSKTPAPDNGLDTRSLAKEDMDPAATSALESPIMVDPSLAEMSNRDAVKPADAPTSLALPPDAGPSAAASRPGGPVLGDMVADARRQKGLAGCSLKISYGAHWSAQLPADLPLYPKAHLEEAAGADSPRCKLRAVTVTTPDAADRVIRFYQEAARKAGYDASVEKDGGAQLVGGTRSDGAAFYTVITPVRTGGTIVDLVVNNGK
jgi:hypothetical protein